MWWKLFLIALPSLGAIDLVWLGVVARGLYREQLGGLLRPDVQWIAAVIFYLLFVAGLVTFVISPAVVGASWTDALWRGAFFGLVTYATYDLTNLATMRGFPLRITLIDLAWGSVLAASVATATYGIASALDV